MRRNWTRDELIVAFNLYCKIPFGQIHIRNPRIIELARALGRTPSALSWKLANFARLDPALQRRNIAGAAHGSSLDAEVWNGFSRDWESLAFESERLLEKLTGRPAVQAPEPPDFPEGKSRQSLVRTRVNQGFFRAAVLAAYGSRCCITGLAVPELLIASHIVPWSEDVKNRTNPRNGLCLNALHDRAFDCGLLTITPDMKVKLARAGRSPNQDAPSKDLLWRYHGAPISLPRTFAPDPKFLRYHNDHKFLGH